MRLALPGALVTSLALFGCVHRPSAKEAAAAAFRYRAGIEECAAHPSRQPYFHVVPFASTPEEPEPGTTLDGFTACWVASQLSAAQEPPLWPAKPGAEVYRFTWLRTFHHPIVIRLERDSRGPRIIGKELDGAGGYATGRIIETTERKLTEAEWAALATPFERLGFWGKAPLEEWGAGADGADWVVEGVRQGRYRVGVFWSPVKGIPIRDACLGLVNATGIQMPPKREIY